MIRNPNVHVIGEIVDIVKIPCSKCKSTDKYAFIMNFKLKEMKLKCLKCGEVMDGFKYINTEYNFTFKKI